jgi:hypothetical protein
MDGRDYAWPGRSERNASSGLGLEIWHSGSYRMLWVLHHISYYSIPGNPVGALRGTDVGNNRSKKN